MTNINEKEAVEAPPVAVIGATGQQGGAVARALLTRGVPVRAVVRDAGAEAARALADAGADLVVATLDDPTSIRRAFAGARAAFAMTSYAGSAGTAGEVEHGRALGQAARDASLPFLLYSSVGGAERATGIPHFESKRRIEEYLADLVPTAFVRPTFFMENLLRLVRRDGEDLVLSMPMPPETPLQMIAAEDIGEVAATVLLDPMGMGETPVEIGGDEKTGAEIIETVARVRGREGRFQEVPLDVLGDDDDRKAMFRWFADAPSYQADFAATQRLHPGVRSLEDWLAEHPEIG